MLSLLSRFSVCDFMSAVTLFGGLFFACFIIRSCDFKSAVTLFGGLFFRVLSVGLAILSLLSRFSVCDFKSAVTLFSSTHRPVCKRVST